MEPTVVLGALSKLIALGVSIYKAWEDPGLGTPELKQLKASLDILKELPSLKTSRNANAPDMEAQYIALVVAAFGTALQDPSVSDWPLENPTTRARWTTEVGLRIQGIVEPLLQPSQPTPKTEVVELLVAHSESLSTPMGTDLYKSLWREFAQQAPTPDSKDPPLINLSKDNCQLNFEACFGRAYNQALTTPGNRELTDYLWLQYSEKRRDVLRRLLMGTLADWGSRHVFGNVRVNEAKTNTALPYMPLQHVYVEPGTVSNPRWLSQRSKWSIRGPALTGLRVALERSRVVVLSANFGHGKSLSARMLAMQWASEFIKNSAVSTGPEKTFPVFLRCAVDLGEEGFDLYAATARAWDRQLQGQVQDLRVTRDQVVDLLDKQSVIFLLDGLDEMVLGDRTLKTFFRTLRDQSREKKHRFIVFSRPAVLPSNDRVMEDIPLLELQEFSAEGEEGGQIGEWLRRWQTCHPENVPLTLEDIQRERDLADLAKTPILLLMIASTWKELQAQKQVTSPEGLPPTNSGRKAQLYELFFRQIARGKHEADLREENDNILEAGRQVLEALKAKNILPPSTGTDTEARVDAMLWLMSRVAWEGRRLEAEDHPRALGLHIVQGLLEQELGIRDNNTATVIKVGLLLTLQTDPELKNDQILFGHQSFREFLIARYWLHTLKRIILERDRHRGPLTQTLLGGNLLGGAQFDFLARMLKQEIRPAHPHWHLAWTDDTQDELRQWLEDVFTTSPGDVGRDNPQFPLLRAVLALRCAMSEATQHTPIEDGGYSVPVPPLRVLLGWQWMWQVKQRALWLQGAILQGANLQGANLQEAYLQGANLQGAILQGADLQGAILQRAYLQGAILKEANLKEAILQEANLQEANLQDAYLHGANLQGANLKEANLKEAILHEANLHAANLHGANLQRAILQGAYLQGADLQRANLQGANLQGADLQRAYLQGAILQRAYLQGADLQGAYLQGADLQGAYLQGANLQGANLQGAYLLNSTYNQDTKWPNNFDPTAHNMDFIAPN